MKKAQSPVALSLVIPLYNEAETVSVLFDRLNKLKTQLPTATEVIFVDDGSVDATLAELRKQNVVFPKRILAFSRNFGHQAALLAGLEHAQGEIVVTLDGDLQHPPEFILKMLEQHHQGIDIVLTQRLDGAETSVFKKVTAAGFYSLLNVLSEMPIHRSASDFRSMNRRAVNSLLALPERRKFLRGMVEWIGFSSIVLPFQVEKRINGTSKFSLLKMLGLALYGVTSFSVIPLYFSALASVGLFILAGLYAVYVLYIRFVMGNAVSGWASVLFINLVVGGLILLLLALLGVYIAAIYIEVKHRPIYILKEQDEHR